MARLDPDFLLRLYRAYAGELGQLARFEAQRPALGGAYHKEERRLLYMMVRRFAPDLVVELSPKRGLSTLHTALALERNGRGRVLSFELSYRSARRALDNLRTNRLDHRVELIAGDVRRELPRVLRRHNITTLEFVFIDCDHRAEFAQWYLEAIFPAVRRQGIVHVHDILTDPLDPCAELPLAPTGEEAEVRRFLAASRGTWDWLSVADCVRDPAYLAAAGALGGGDVSLAPENVRPRDLGITAEWNPSLWLVKRSEPEATSVPEPAAGPTQLGLRPLIDAWRKRRLAAIQRR